VTLKKLDDSYSYQIAYAKLIEMNLLDDDNFFAYKMQVRDDRKIKLPSINELDTMSSGNSSPSLLSPNVPFQGGEVSYHLNADPFSSGSRLLSPRFNGSYLGVLGEAESPQHSRRGSAMSSRRSSQYSSGSSMNDMLKTLQERALEDKASFRTGPKGRRNSTKAALVQSILTRRASALPTSYQIVENSASNSNYAAPSKEFFRRGSRRQSVGWNPAPIGIPVFITETPIVSTRPKMTLKFLMKKIVCLLVN
jgi:hypothetical protein